MTAMGLMACASTRARRSARAAVAVVSVSAAMFVVPTGVGAGTDECAGERVIGWDGGLVLSADPGPATLTVMLPVPLAGGGYDIEAFSFDRGSGRKDLPPSSWETSERWYAEFIGVDGDLVGALPRATTDLPDDTDDAAVLDRFTGVVLDADAVAVRLVLVGEPGSADLVRVGCLGFTSSAALLPDPSVPPATIEVDVTIGPRPTGTTVTTTPTPGADPSSPDASPSTMPLPATIPAAAGSGSPLGAAPFTGSMAPPAGPGPVGDATRALPATGAPASVPFSAGLAVGLVGVGSCLAGGFIRRRPTARPR